MKFVSQPFKFNDIRAQASASGLVQAGFGAFRCCVATTPASLLGSVPPVWAK
jgi:hypothetical protein